ncbi:SMAD/FHA domain-containing protein [Mycena floridula]|nr:SMAD/FHA domain-containing protein [Mycena floridula]
MPAIVQLHPVNATFPSKKLSLRAGIVDVGRECDDKIPGIENGYFTSKSMSRLHAQIWEDDSKVFIKDTRSFNGTFVNGDRLSGKQCESEPRELKTDDIIQFCTDILADDQVTVNHPKIVVRVEIVSK